MREPMVGPKRFGDLRAGLPGIGANVLAQRLEGLEVAGVARRRRRRCTSRRSGARKASRSSRRRAARSPAHDPSLPFSAASLLLSLRTMLDPERAEGIEARVGLRVGDETFLCRLAGGAIGMAAAPLDGADAVFPGTAAAIAGAIHGGRKLEEMETEGALRIEGDRALAEWSVTLFPLPTKAARVGG